MKRTINVHEFRDAFRDMGRGDQFTYGGFGVLFEWFEQYAEDCDTETELDVIAICCEFCEAEWQDIADDYSIDLTDCDDDDEREETVVEYLQENTVYVGATDSTYLYAAF